MRLALISLLTGSLAVGCGGDGQKTSGGPPSFEPEEDTGVEADIGWTDVSAAWEHSCGVTTSGSILCWGRNYYGQTIPPEL